MTSVAQDSSNCAPHGAPGGSHPSSGQETLSMELSAIGCCAFGTCSTKWVRPESIRASASRERPSSKSTQTPTPRSIARVNALKEACRHRSCSSTATWEAPAPTSPKTAPRALSNSRGGSNAPRALDEETAPGPSRELLEGTKPCVDLSLRLCCLSDGTPICCLRYRAAGASHAGEDSPPLPAVASPLLPNTLTCSRVSINAFVRSSCSSPRPQQPCGLLGRHAPMAAQKAAAIDLPQPLLRQAVSTNCCRWRSATFSVGCRRLLLSIQIWKGP
mmetsp:Transcript_70903/g.140664  ORF Transcript_70903/g.140664 Transcript_70903/m.140664 type:complete len:274 (+) Transcript_70903:475-1296(+)